MSKTMKKVSALLLALLMIVTFMPMTQESVYAAKKKAKKPGKVTGLSVSIIVITPVCRGLRPMQAGFCYKVELSSLTDLKYGLDPHWIV